MGSYNWAQARLPHLCSWWRRRMEPGIFTLTTVLWTLWWSRIVFLFPLSKNSSMRSPVLESSPNSTSKQVITKCASTFTTLRWQLFVTTRAYEFLVMHFGYKNAPSTFQFLMNSVFRKVLRKYVLVFFDDILIHSACWDSHIDHLRPVFHLLREHHLHAKKTKCEFGQTEISYLGQKISYQGVVVDPDKISAICDWPTLMTIKSLRGFSCLNGYYRWFVHCYASLAKPLTALLCKNAFVWSPAASQDF